jgi:hypothetical protein
MSSGTLIFSTSANAIGANSSPSPNTVPIRDGSGNLIGTGMEGTAFLSTLGSLFLNSAIYTSAANLDLNETVVLANANSAAFTLTLPAASLSANQVYLVIKTDSSAHVPTIAGFGGSDLIDATGATANTYSGLTARAMAVLLFCDGVQWWAMKLT